MSQSAFSCQSFIGFLPPRQNHKDTAVSLEDRQHLQEWRSVEAVTTPAPVPIMLHDFYRHFITWSVVR